MALGRSQSRGRGFDRRFRRGSSPAARVKGPERFTRSGRTCGWAWEAKGMVGTVLSAVGQFAVAKVKGLGG